MAVASIGLYVLWLFILHYTSKKLDEITYSRIKAIKKALSERIGYEFGIHRYIDKETKSSLWIEDDSGL